MDNSRSPSDEKPDLRRRALLTLMLGAAILPIFAGRSAMAQMPRRRMRRFREMQNRIRGLVISGEIRPLRDSVSALMAEVDGEILDVAFHQFEAGYFYEFKMLTASGRIEDFFVNASTTQIFTSSEASNRFPKDFAKLTDRRDDGSGETSGPNAETFDNLPERVRVVLGDIEDRIGEKIVDYNLERLGNSRVFRVDVRGEGGGWHRFFVSARTGEIRTPEEARDIIARLFPELYERYFP